MVFYEHTPPFSSTFAHIIPCTESHTNNYAQLHSTILKFSKRFPDLDLLWTVLNQWDKKKAMGTGFLSHLTRSVHFSPPCLPRPPVFWMRVRDPRAEWSSPQSSAPRYDRECQDMISLHANLCWTDKVKNFSIVHIMNIILGWQSDNPE